ncbi:hypothetical protein A5816_001559 [Enterococcus sp. 3G1_DIV0629]|uniref:immunoglobulin-like domain-containing protein n=1 Tax=Enterococcus sp. (strain 3G1_DIV0629) TaxID=1834176 RepID=UPI000B6E2EAA|nr:hypothetical protein A5816_001559 [Enterococcus sp. 3G1_DIV0629]
MIPDEYVFGSRHMFGSYTGDIKFARAYVNGVAQAIGGEFSLGRYDYYIGGAIKQKDDIVEIDGRDKNNEVIVPKQRIKVE